MAKTFKILTLPGDGIGPEVVTEATKLLEWINQNTDYSFEIDTALIGGAAYDATGSALPQETLDKVDAADAILLGAVGGPKWDKLPPMERPELGGILALRKHMETFANLRPAKVFPALADASALKPELVEGLDILIIRELVSGVYFGDKTRDGDRAHDDMTYSLEEIERIAKVAFDVAQTNGWALTSVDKANVLETSRLWREVVEGVHSSYKDVPLSHMYVDNASMQLVTKPKQFQVIVTENLFGDILSDTAAALTGSLGMLPSASLGPEKDSGIPAGLYEPIHGSAPDIVGLGVANPLATILSVAMMFQYSFKDLEIATAIESAVNDVLEAGFRTKDIMRDGKIEAGTAEMGSAVINVMGQKLSQSSGSTKASIGGC